MNIDLTHQDSNIDQVIREIKDSFCLNTSGNNYDKAVLMDYSQQYYEQMKSINKDLKEDKTNEVANYTIPIESEMQNLKNEHKLLKAYIRISKSCDKLDDYCTRSDLNTLNEESRRELEFLLNLPLLSNYRINETFKNLKLVYSKTKIPSELYQINRSKYYQVLKGEIIKLVDLNSILGDFVRQYQDYSAYERFQKLGNSFYPESQFKQFFSEEQQHILDNKLSELKKLWNCDNKFDENVIYVLKNKFKSDIVRSDYIQLLFMYYIIENTNNFICPYLINIFDYLKTEISIMLLTVGNLGVEADNFPLFFNFILDIVKSVSICQGIKKFMFLCVDAFKSYIKHNKNLNLLPYFLSIEKIEESKRDHFRPIYLFLVNEYSQMIIDLILKNFPQISEIFAPPTRRNQNNWLQAKQIIKYGPLNQYLSNIMTSTEFVLNFQTKKDIITDALEKIYRKIGEPFKPQYIFPEIFSK
ncbi:hypothetical protein TVAG_487160 [Trichomonas vaginalis G3]|uniref:Uncharacterized protein n=1 Tax=Trichomonas vaginalis (strain ATCC PRA-98 / G3) TaxID=412133 RepID=A2DZE4_TRIV3|nr:guanyl-nucleotide exchange factor protein [Trichomonas vaginalis G3]EAY14273.1 hypothetical protein TVAG_487160 [Trichomonas vaginalis G3]KAI5491866.1 guanyl-nucleotide exchange factor protein [Trichomonas vaginalis G3]|eukprot:XP_001326496.1 hypothetical protein [Trichomonas vaginalis G3]